MEAVSRNAHVKYHRKRSRDEHQSYPITRLLTTLLWLRTQGHVTSIKAIQLPGSLQLYYGFLTQGTCNVQEKDQLPLCLPSGFFLHVLMMLFATSFSFSGKSAESVFLLCTGIIKHNSISLQLKVRHLFSKQQQQKTNNQTKSHTTKHTRNRKPPRTTG